VAEKQRLGMVALARGAEAQDTDTGDHIVRVQLASPTPSCSSPAR